MMDEGMVHHQGASADSQSLTVAESELEIDVEVIDGIVNGVGQFFRGLGSALRPIQTGYTANYAAAIVVGAIFIMGYVLLGGLR